MKLTFKVTRLYCFENEGSTKAVCDVTLCDEFLVRGFRVVSGKEGVFVSSPSEYGKDGKWHGKAFALTDEAKQALTKTIIAAYEEHKERAPRSN